MFLAQMILTALTSFLLATYLRPHLKRVLIDLCGTEERAQFWTAFTNVILIALPAIFGMGFQPKSSDAQQMFFEIADQIKWNLLGFIAALMGAGFVVSFFALIAPRSKNS
jgi:hypothetical protein